MGKGAGAFYSPCVSPLAPAGGMVHFFPSLAPMKLRRRIFRVALFRSVSVSACLAAGSAQAQWATINTISNPPGAFTITCTDFPVPGPQQVCAVSPPLPVGSTVRGNCGGNVRMVDDPARPNTWLYQVGPRPADRKSTRLNSSHSQISYS